MKLKILEDGKTKLRRFWGVTHVPEKRSPRGVEAAQKLKGPESEQAVEHALERSVELAVAGEKWENITAGFYKAQISIFGHQHYIGKAATPQAAARLFDSALFHLWGFLHRPKLRFNFLKPEDLPHNPPSLFPQVQELKEKLLWNLKELGADVSLLDFTFLQRHEQTRNKEREELLKLLSK